jgi:hypothetical protein
LNFFSSQTQPSSPSSISKVQNLSTSSEAAQEIQQLLAKLLQTYPTNTKAEKQIFVAQVDEQIKNDSRLRSILMAGVIKLIKVLCPPLRIPIEMGQKWLDTARKTNDL